MTIPKIGLTGGIASGKSTVANAFTQLGVTVVYADQIARDVVEPGTPALAAIAKTFGSSVLTPNGELDRAAMRARVFSETGAQARRQLEAITHPAINSEVKRQAFSAAGPYVVLELPLLVEKQHYAWLDRILLVDIAETLQLTRLANRSGIAGQQAQAMLAAQASRADRLAVADDIFDNSGSEANITAAVTALHQHYSEWARSDCAPPSLRLP